jgi:epoxyqueuosine reductase
LQNSTQIKEKIRSLSAEIGFDDCGFAKVCEVESEYRRFFENWLENGFNSKMEWIKKNVDIRFNPKLLLENAKSVIVVLQSHNFLVTPQKNKVARYLLQEDYHVSMRKKLRILSQKINEILPDTNSRICVDSAPILEKYWAQKAKLGFVGKNTLFISNKIGSFCNIAVLLIDKELEIEESHKNSQENSCGNCNKCIKSCPTGALVENYTLDCNKCISYQNNYKVDENFDCFGYVQGCDICQEVCPKNAAFQI